MEGAGSVLHVVRMLTEKLIEVKVSGTILFSCVHMASQRSAGARRTAAACARVRIHTLHQAAQGESHPRGGTPYICLCMHTHGRTTRYS